MNLEWRIIDIEEREGSFNTAIDVALLESVGNNESKPAIVMTEWKPTVSLGNSQSYFLDVDEKACKKHNVQVVRRRSGGQAVFLDNNYFVFSVIAKPDMFPKDLTLLRKWFCNMVVEMLTDYDVPVEFYQPDNIVIRNGDKFRTIGNSGQVITSKAIAVHGSVRYSLKNLDVMTDVLKVNGQKLQQFEDEIKDILGDVTSHNPNIAKKDLKTAFVTHFAGKYSAKYIRDNLKDSEIDKINAIASDLTKNVAREDRYKSRGVCYFFLNGQNLVPSLQQFLPYNTPSLWQESVVQIERDENGI